MMWRSYPDARATAAAAARHILMLLDNALAGQDRATFAISGGSTPKLLFAAPVNNGGDVTADHKRFLLATTPGAGQQTSTPITVVLNWQAGLKK